MIPKRALQLEVSERPVPERFGHLELGEREPVVELDVVEHPAGDQVGDAFAHVGFGVDDVVCADALEDSSVRW